MDKIVVEDVTEYFEKRLRQKNEYDVNTFEGEGPKFPMLIVYLGEQAQKMHQELSDMLNRIWPPYDKVIGYLRAEPSLDYDTTRSLDFFSVGCKEPSKCLEEGEWRSYVANLFDANSGYSDFSKLFVYYIIDSTILTTEEEFHRWANVIKDAKEHLKMEHQMSLLLLLLNERFEYTQDAIIIRRMLGEAFYEQSGQKLSVNSAFLVSNKRSDGGMVNDKRLICRMAANIIVLANHHDADVVEAMFSPIVKMVGYALEEKPSKNIAKVVAASLIKQLDCFRLRKDVGKFLGAEDLAKRLGISENGTMEILDYFAERELIPLLPSREELGYFPRKDYVEEEDGVYTANEFDELTMGAWNRYLTGIVGQAQNRLDGGHQQRDQWKQQYRSFLAAEFTADELVLLSDNMSSVRKIFHNVKEPSCNQEVLASAEGVLKYNLSADADLATVFLEALVEEGDSAKEFMQAWSYLTKSLSGLFSVRDENLKNFYEKRVQSYFDRHGAILKQEFDSLNSVESLWKFLEATVNQMLSADTVYSESFENELQKRLEMTANPVDAKSYIRSHLTGNEVKTYLHISFALEKPILSVMLLKQGTSLYKTLKESLSNVRYYDTGCGDAAEALMIYQVEYSNLIS